MTCQDVVELVTAYLERTMPDEERARFEAHLAVCAGCDVYVRQMQRTIELLGSASTDSLSPRARQRLLDTFADWKRATSSGA